MQNLITWFLNLVMQVEALHQAQADPYERTVTRCAHRNGYKERSLKTRFGELSLREPQFRELPFETKIFGKDLLWIFGEEYARNSFELLLILVLGSVSFAVNALYASVKRVQKEIKPVIWIYAGIAVITLVAGYLLMGKFGLIGYEAVHSSSTLHLTFRSRFSQIIDPRSKGSAFG